MMPHSWDLFFSSIEGSNLETYISVRPEMVDVVPGQRSRTMSRMAMSESAGPGR
jgi:hypothetical protein